MRRADLCLALCLAPSLAGAQAADGVRDLGRPSPGAVALRLVSAGAPLHVVVERRVERPPAESRARGVVVAAGRCDTPCTLWVPPGLARLRANARGVRGTDEDVTVPDGGATMRVRAGDAALHTLGVGLAAAGATAILATMFVALADQGIFAGTSRGSIGLEPAAIVGATAGGAALLAGGIPLLLLHRDGVSRVSAAPALAVHPAGVLATWRF